MMTCRRKIRCVLSERALYIRTSFHPLAGLALDTRPGTFFCAQAFPDVACYLIILSVRFRRFFSAVAAEIGGERAEPPPEAPLREALLPFRPSRFASRV
jgi:hypothetical protein